MSVPIAARQMIAFQVCRELRRHATAGFLPRISSDGDNVIIWSGHGQDHLEVDDCGWCIRTGPDGRIDLKKTIRAIESSYDCEILSESGPLAVDDSGATGPRPRWRMERHPSLVAGCIPWGIRKDLRVELNC